MPSQTTQVVPWVDSLPPYIVAALRRVGLSRRKYQETACLDALHLFRDGNNVEINLPPGTGKTLISQIVGCVWIREGSGSDNKVLCVLPSSALREQHYSYCVWWAGEAGLCEPLEVKSEWIQRRGVWHQRQAEQSDFWFALPRVFCNAVKSAHVPFSALKRVGLVILDEYDTFSIGVLRAEGYSLRFSKPSERLFRLLEQKERRYLLMSATPARNRVEQ
jgi:ERCC4-related helicase